MLKWQGLDKRFTKNHKGPLLLWAALILLAIIAISLSPYGYFNIWISKHYQAPLGVFFRFYTFLGEEWLLITLGVLLAIGIKSRTLALRILLTLTINSLITTVLKYLIFNQNRPKLVLQKFNLIFTEGVKMNEYNSFPSGHTSAAFAMAFALSFWFINKKLSAPLLLLALGVGLSRIYLQQHFLEDVVAGACIGLLSAFLASGFVWQNKTEKFC